MRNYFLYLLLICTFSLEAQTVAVNHFSPIPPTEMKNAPTFLDSVTHIEVARQNFTLPKQKLNYWRLEDENDALVLRQGTDRYYTNGFLLDHIFCKNGFNSPISNVLFPKITNNANNYYGFLFRIAMYTPDTVQRIKAGIDHPYAGTLTVGMSNISKNSETGASLTTEYQLGVMGPASGQEWLQKTAHRMAGKSNPVGWENQIPNDIAFNIRLTYEHPILSYSNKIEALALTTANLGTMSNNFGMGGRLKMGRFYKSQQAGLPFVDVKLNKNWQFFTALQYIGYFVQDNAMLQGGILLDNFNRKQYISIEDIKHWVGEGTLSYSLSYKNIGFTYRYCVRSPSFKTGKPSFYGGLSLQFGF